MAILKPKLTDEDVAAAAQIYSLPYALLKALVEIESSGRGYGPDGRILIRFEPGVFDNYVSKAVAAEPADWNSLERKGQGTEWAMFDSAFTIDANAAKMSTSYGLMQVMGFNYLPCKFTSVQAMIDFAEESEYNQLVIAARFINASSVAKTAIKRKDWAAFAKFYNGSGYAANSYDVKLKRAYDKHNPPVLRMLSRGTWVAKLHERLNKHVGLVPDNLALNSFTKATDTAVRKFQSKNDLDVDGIVGEATWLALLQ